MISIRKVISTVAKTLSTTDLLLWQSGGNLQLEISQYKTHFAFNYCSDKASICAQLRTEPLPSAMLIFGFVIKVTSRTKAQYWLKGVL